MSTLLAKVLADFSTSLATAIVVGGTTATLQSATDDDGIALVAGRYFFTLDGENNNKEHFSCDLSGTSLTNLKSVSRQGVESAGAVRAHRIGSTVSLTDFAHLFFMNNLLAGTTTFNASVPLGYDGTASITTANQFATKAYVDTVAVAGAPNASTTVKGIVEEATQAEVNAKTAAGATGAELYVNPATLASTLLSDYKADTGAADAAVITPVPAITAYVAGQRFSVKMVATNTTTTPTLNVNGVGAKTIVKTTGALAAGDLLVNKIYEFEYDGTNMQLLGLGSTDVLPSQTSNAGKFLTTNASSSSWGYPYDYQVFTGNGTWTKPSNLVGTELVIVKVYGAGGGGSTGTFPSGGGGGACTEAMYRASDLGATVSVTIGTGGAAGATGGTGGSSSFGSTQIAYGGAGGIGNASGGGGAGGGGVLSAGSVGSTTTGGGGGDPAGGAGAGLASGFGGGGGGNAVNGTGGSAVFGGGGGGSGGNSLNPGGPGGMSINGGGGGGGNGTAGAGAGGVSLLAGAGGAGGGAGNAPSGGGGSSAAGARGEVRVWVIK